MTDEEYEQLVVAECKNPEEVDSGELYNDFTRWVGALERLISEVDEQKEIKKADLDQAKVDTFPQETDEDERAMLEAEATYSMWSAKANKYRRHLSERLTAVQKLAREATGVDAAVSESRDRVLTEVQRLCKIGEGSKELQAAWLQLEVAYEMRIKAGE